MQAKSCYGLVFQAPTRITDLKLSVGTSSLSVNDPFRIPVPVQVRQEVDKEKIL
jgi:hypothetical protein